MYDRSEPSGLLRRVASRSKCIACSGDSFAQASHPTDILAGNPPADPAQAEATKEPVRIYQNDHGGTLKRYASHLFRIIASIPCRRVPGTGGAGDEDQPPAVAMLPPCPNAPVSCMPLASSSSVVPSRTFQTISSSAYEGALKRRDAIIQLLDSQEFAARKVGPTPLPTERKEVVNWHWPDVRSVAARPIPNLAILTPTNNSWIQEAPSSVGHRLASGKPISG